MAARIEPVTTDNVIVDPLRDQTSRLVRRRLGIVDAVERDATSEGAPGRAAGVSRNAILAKQILFLEHGDWLPCEARN
jgi:hypothetical protein